MKQILEKILYWLAWFILIRRDPTVVAITGSVGKTSAKEAVAMVLQHRYTVRASQENYNNEIGVPLAIIGASTGGKNPLRWWWIMVKAVITSLFPLPYPEILVLEMGADKPGDLKYLTRLAPADIGIVTAITETPAHLQNFKTVDQVAKEKLTMYKQLPKLSWGIVNADEPRVQPVVATAKFRVFTVGIEHEADLRASEIDCVFSEQIGVRFKFHYQGSVVPCFIPGVIGQPVVYSALFAAAVGLVSNMNLVDITAALKQYQGPRGRLRVLPGRNSSVIIDDTYNAAPAAMQAAISTLQALSTTGRKLVCLGEMAELGEQAKAAHQTIGKMLAEGGVDGVYVVGEAGAWIAEAAMKYGLPEEAIHTFANSQAAGVALTALVQPHDVILVKGSQAVRMEKTVVAIMAQPEQAADLLVRQYGHWTAS